MKLALPALLGVAGLLAACADYPPPPPPAPPPPGPVAAVPVAPVGDGCFRTSDIVNHTVGDDHTLYVATRTYGVWRLEMVGACLAGAGSDDPLVIREPPGVPYACRPVDLDISIRRGGTLGVATPCIVNTMVRLTPAEVAALPDRLRP